MRGTREWELAALVVLGGLGLFLGGIALLSLKRDVIGGAAVLLALPAALYAAWLVRFAVRRGRRE